MKRKLRIGLTGGIASGKTTVSDIFRSLGAPVIDADETTRRITRRGEQAYKEIVSLFGDEILNKDGDLKRDRIKEIIFRDRDMKNKLEGIIHPKVQNDMEAQIASSDYPYCILSIPLLLESGADYRLDRILVIDIPEDKQLERTVKRDGIPEELALSIIRSQADRKQRISAADDVIKNTGDLKHLEKQVKILHQKYLELASTFETGHKPSSERSANLH